MEEETKTTSEPPPTAKDIDDGNKSATASILDKADSLAKRMEKANEDYKKLVERNEAVAARMLLSGRSAAGTVQKTKEEIDAEKMDVEVTKALKAFRP